MPEVVGTYLYQTPLPLTELRGINFIHPGLWLGTLKKNRFEPAHALALALKTTQARHDLPLDPGGEHCLAYLRGETTPASLVEGAAGGYMKRGISVEETGT